MKKRILSIGLCLSILTTMIMNNNNSVFAITSDEASQKGFTVDITKGSVYYGKDKDNNPALYRVVYSNASTVTLLYHGNATDKGNFINKEFDASSYNMWENSVACIVITSYSIHYTKLYEEVIANELIAISKSFNIDAKIIGRCAKADKKRLTIKTANDTFEY